MRLQIGPNESDCWMAHFHHGTDVADGLTAPQTAQGSADILACHRDKDGKWTFKIPPIRFTSCIMHAGRCPERPRGVACSRTDTITGMAWCSPLDNFVRQQGVYQAFKRAVAQVPERRLRGKLWEKFVEQVNIPKKYVAGAKVARAARIARADAA